MPRKPLNPLIKLAKIMGAEIDRFPLRYDMADDKKEIVRSIGDLHNLPPENKGLYAKVTLALNITDDVYNDCMLYMLNHHSNQNGINHTSDSDRLYAMSDFIVQAYVDVSIFFSFA